MQGNTVHSSDASLLSMDVAEAEQVSFLIESLCFNYCKLVSSFIFVFNL